jgi:hypothetical protein
MEHQTIFLPAIQEMRAKSISCREPESFDAYIKRNGLENAKQKRTAEYISVQGFNDLDTGLKAERIMVFRLGSLPGTKSTAFGLARVSETWDEYFFFDDALFGKLEAEVFVPKVPYSALYSLALVPTLTESSLANIAVASGLISEVLGVDPQGVPSIPATGQSTYSFRFKPNSSYQTIFEHRHGQVEIDGVFVCSIGSRATVVVLEAKSGEFGSLAKHKLFYPMEALREKIPTFMPIIGIYLRVQKREQDLYFNLAICRSTRDDFGVSSVDSLRVTSARKIVLVGLHRI